MTEIPMHSWSDVPGERMRCIAILVGLLLLRPMTAQSEPLTLDDALDTALGHTARAGMIRGGQEVAEQNYQARRITFFVPAISINGAVPSYSVDQSYRFFGSSARKSLYKTRGLGLNSFIQLSQSLLTGGNLEVKANLNADRNRYPDTGPLAATGTFLDERSRQGYFDFSVSQPLLKPSTPKNELEDRRDDLALARLSRREEETALAREVIAAYLGTLELAVQREAAASKSEGARLQAAIDSVKWTDGVITEEAWLISSSSRLDAELAERESDSALAEQRRTLALLLDREPSEPLEPVEPTVAEHPGPERREALLQAWERSVAVQKAEYGYAKADRAAAFAAAGHGLTGDFKATYSVGRGKVRLDQNADNDINTNGWGVALNFSYPIWDGGASSAAVKAARFEAERARLELQKAKQNSRAEIARLVDQLDVSYRRLEILRKQIELAESRLRVAQTRLESGRISQVIWLQSKVAVLDSRSKYLKELETYLSNRISLAQGFVD
jgi:outer membrane protein TolC